MVETAVAEGLQVKGGGAIDNGPTRQRPSTPRQRNVTIATPVVTSLVSWWDCETVHGCRGTGVGGETMLQHAAEAHGGVGRFTDCRWN